MKKILRLILFIFLFIPVVIFGKEKDINMYLFYGDGCPHCAALEEYLDSYLKDKDNVHLYKYEVWYNEENAQKYSEVKKLLNDESNGIPFLIIGNNTIVGYIEDYTDELIDNTIKYYSNVSYYDGVGVYLGVIKDNNEEWDRTIKYDGNITEENGTSEIDVPDYLDGVVNNAPLLISTIVIGFIDGINPCAMWILLFLISMLLGIKNKKRKIALGVTFLLTSAIIYFLFLVSWINLASFLSKITYIRLGIAIVSVILGSYSIIKFVGSSKEDGCEVVNTKNRKRIINAIKKIVKEKAFILAILGIAALSACVNVIELMCSLGLPVMFTEILVMNNVNTTWKLIYSAIYVFFFLIDDITIFIIAMKTMEIKVISNKIGKYAHLVGGIIMLIIGILMIYKPNWLMLNF